MENASLALRFTACQTIRGAIMICVSVKRANRLASLSIAILPIPECESVWETIPPEISI